MMRIIFNPWPVLFLMLMLAAGSCRQNPSKEAKEEKAVIDLDAALFKERMAKEPGMLIDVRTAGEFEEGYITGAVNFDIHSDDFKPLINKLDRSATYYVYCRSGSRSSSAAGYMKEIGFTRVYNLDGGITGWVDRDLPVEKKEGPEGR